MTWKQNITPEAVSGFGKFLHGLQQQKVRADAWVRVSARISPTDSDNNWTGKKSYWNKIQYKIDTQLFLIYFQKSKNKDAIVKKQVHDAFQVHSTVKLC